jgi:hypothetical protein
MPQNPSKDSMNRIPRYQLLQLEENSGGEEGQLLRRWESQGMITKK